MKIYFDWEQVQEKSKSKERGAQKNRPFFTPALLNQHQLICPKK